MSYPPIRGQRRRGVPSLVLPGDPDGCGWIDGEPGVFVPSGLGWGDRAPGVRYVRYVGRPSRWGNPWQVERVVLRDEYAWGVALSYEPRVPPVMCDSKTAALARAASMYCEGMKVATPGSLNALSTARHIAPLVTADVLSCWCPLDAPCHADTLCDLVGRLRSGDLVPGLVATPDMFGALHIDGTSTDVEWVAGAITERLGWENWTEERAILTVAAECSIDPDLVRLAALVGGAL